VAPSPARNRPRSLDRSVQQGLIGRRVL